MSGYWIGPFGVHVSDKHGRIVSPDGVNWMLPHNIVIGAIGTSRKPLTETVYKWTLCIKYFDGNWWYTGHGLRYRLWQWMHGYEDYF